MVRLARLLLSAATVMAVALGVAACGDATGGGTVGGAGGAGEADTSGTVADTGPTGEAGEATPSVTTEPTAPPTDPPGTTPPDGRLTVEVLERVPHDPTAFTQGLEWHEGELYESTGRYGESTLRRVDPATGEVLESRPLDGAYFGEGLTIVDDTLIQLTWQEQTAFVHELDGLAPLGELTYAGEGWGICDDGTDLFTTDGSATLTRRDRDDFSVLDQVTVVAENGPVADLNELECVGGDVYANVRPTDLIVRIEPSTGTVEAVIDASGLLTADEAAAAVELNGIAHVPGTDTFWITGKLWPWSFLVRFVPEAGGR